MTEPKLYRYCLPNIDGQGWAEIVVCSTGMFAAVSDYGNYAFAWRSFGPTDFREFLLNSERDWDYFARKFAGGVEEYDGQATLRAIKREILQWRRSHDVTKEQARCEWNIAVESNVDYNADGFRDWLEARNEARRMGLQVVDWDEVWHMAEHRIPQQVEAFCKRVMPRLCALIRAELAAERKEVA